MGLIHVLAEMLTWTSPSHSVLVAVSLNIKGERPAPHVYVFFFSILALDGSHINKGGF